MNAKKMTAAFIIMMMVATCIPLADSDASVGSSDNAADSFRNAGVGDVVGVAMSGEYSMDKDPDITGQVLSAVLEGLKEYLELDDSTILELIGMLASKDSSVGLVESLLTNPGNVQVSKDDVKNLVNDLLGSLVTVNDLDIGVSYVIDSAMTRSGERMFENISMADIVIDLSLDAILHDEDSTDTALVLEDGVIEIKFVEDTVANFNKIDSKAVAKGALYIGIHGMSTFIDDEAESMDSMFVLMDDLKEFDLSMTVEGLAKASVTTSAMSGQTVTLSAYAGLEARTDNEALKEIADEITSSTSSSQTFTYTCDERRFPGMCMTEIYKDQTHVGNIKSGPGIYYIEYDSQGMRMMALFDLTNMDMKLVIDEACSKEIVIEAGLDHLLVETDEDTAYDLSWLMEPFRSGDNEYGSNYVLTADEVKQFNREVSELANGIGSSISGFPQNDGAPDSSDLDRDHDQDVPVVPIAAIVIALIVTAFAYFKDRN